jgi:hypothetical protein
VLPRCRAVLSGYLGSEENGGTVLDAVEQVRAAWPASFCCCDPVMGDRDSGLYVADSLVRFFATGRCLRPTSSPPTITSWRCWWAGRCPGSTMSSLLRRSCGRAGRGFDSLLPSSSFRPFVIALSAPIVLACGPSWRCN